ncbi:MAG: digeranylgeranylglyceryl phosphate synthase [Hadesarchaea archaeon]|nr:MAG: digeranylgeranylglyceryl phosphate synthase [Hadesarchaea archaeon]HDI12964.1 digeranylgeranylglyceryl phosphate synthase [Hadesarchaea archaeon]
MRTPPLLELVRPINCVLAGIAVIIGVVVATGGLNISRLILLLAFTVAAFVSGGGNAINDYFDRDIDRINRPNRPIPSGKITPKVALFTAHILFTTGIIFTIFLNIYCFLLATLNSVILFVYAWKLKRLGLVGNISIGYLVGSTLLFGGLATAHLRGGILVPAELLVLATMMALSTIGRELIKAVEDMRGDKKLGFKTFPITHGVEWTTAVAAGFICAAVALSPIPYLMGIFRWPYLLFLTFSAASFLAAIWIMIGKGEKAAGNASLACKLGMGIGLLGFLIGAFL